MLAGLSEDQSLVPRTNLDSSQPTVIPAPRNPMPSSSLGKHARHAYTAHTHKKLNFLQNPGKICSGLLISPQESPVVNEVIRWFSEEYF